MPLLIVDLDSACCPYPPKDTGCISRTMFVAVRVSSCHKLGHTMSHVTSTEPHHGAYVSEVGYMLNGVSVQLERRLWLTVEGHILSFGCADFKSKVCCGISGPRAETGPVGWKTQGERYHQQSPCHLVIWPDVLLIDKDRSQLRSLVQTPFP